LSAVQVRYDVHIGRIPHVRVAAVEADVQERQKAIRLDAVLAIGGEEQSSSHQVGDTL